MSSLRLLGMRTAATARSVIGQGTSNSSTRVLLRHAGATATAAPDVATAWFYRDCWGFDSIPAHSDDAKEREVEMLGYAQALCYAISADGQASAPEIEWVQGYLACKGYGSLAQEVEDMAKAGEGKSLEQIVADTTTSMEIGSLKFAGRAIVYDSIRASMADGIAAKEEVAIKAIAAAFHVEDYDQIKELAMEEEAHRAKKAKLIVADHPNLAAEYQ